jgi:hypothetical protein
MHDPLRRAAIVCGLLLSLIVVFSVPVDSFGQRRQTPLVCKRLVLAALKPKPELSYPCDEQLQDWDEKILKLPARVAAIQSLMSDLSSYSDAAWWAADVVDLGVCDFRKEPGPLSLEQRHDFLNSEYLFWLFGNERMRVVLVADPCYQTQYGGSNAFLLYRDGRRIVVNQVLDGYFSRADNSVSVAFAKLGTEDIVEVATGSGGLNPTLTNYYFAIDPRSRRAVPKNLFISEHGPTNEITSGMLLETGGAEPLKLVRGHALANTFILYTEAENGKIHDSGRTLSRKILRWNGKVYR